MVHRSVITVLLLSLLTCGIYVFFWLWATKEEMNEQGCRIPTALLLIIPIANIYWMWKYSEGVDLITGGTITSVFAFILLWFASVFAPAILQAEFNNYAQPRPPRPMGPPPPMGF